MNPTQSIDEAVSILLSEFDRLMNTDDERLELESLRSSWNRINDWASRAEQLLTRNGASVGNNSASAALMKRLKIALNGARADLKLTPEKIMKAVEQVARGEWIPASELRADLERRRASQSRPMAV